MKNGVRKSAVDGRFYPASPAKLEIEMTELFAEAPDVKGVQSAVAVMSPHAGIMFSGRVAAAVFKNIQVPKHIVIFSPNHTGLGISGSLHPPGEWLMPFGEVKIDEEITSLLKSASHGVLDYDELAHSQEHSLEVLLPFIYHRRKDFLLTAVVLGGMHLSDCLELGDALVDIHKKYHGDVLFIASSDMTHFMKKAECKKLDDKALAYMQKLDATGLFKVVNEKHISMCGFQPATVITQFASRLEGVKFALVDYDHSSRKTYEGDDGVAYAGVIFHK